MKEIYIEIIDKALSAYSSQRIDDYIKEVRENGLKEHGFPRLAANIGILLAHSKRSELLNTFIEMMDICCNEMPIKKAANDFTVKEICFCIAELKKNPVDGISSQMIDGWIEKLSHFVPELYYNVVASYKGEQLGNWAAFAAASEYMRKLTCNTKTDEFIDRQISSQMMSFDENGMYKDPNNPLVYDYTTRNQLVLPLYFGYKGEFAEEIDRNMRKAGDLSLKMQSTSGEMPYGGRSIQFLHNETTIAATYEYEATRYAKEGNPEKAGEFKAAAKLACESVLKWLNSKRIVHVKNYYPADSLIGCEKYGYFNKYMITLASMAYMAYVFADDSIVPTKAPAEKGGYIATTSDDFHKIFVTNADYHLEFDVDADFHYDANGLGRVHKKGVRSQACLTVPFPENPEYKLAGENSRPMSLCVFLNADGTNYYGAEQGCKYEITERIEKTEKTVLSLDCILTNGSLVKAVYCVSSSGVDISVSGKGQVGLCLPAFGFDGENETSIDIDEKSITVKYLDSSCRYSFDGNLDREYEYFYNRSGKYRVYRVSKKDNLKVRIELNQE